MKAGNAVYHDIADLPEIIPVFPLAGALLLPGGLLPLNIFEPRYLSMVDHALAGGRLIGMIQPGFDRPEGAVADSVLCDLGCVGRIVSMRETGDGRYLITLHGICRFHLREEIAVETPFRQCRIQPFPTDLQDDSSAENVDRVKLMRTLRAYLEANDFDADWQSFLRADNGTLVNGLAMMAPFGAAEKQALLDAPDLRARAETLIAITERILARKEGHAHRTLQ